MSTPIALMVNGLPGKMAAAVVRHALRDSRFSVVPRSLTGPDIESDETLVDGVPIRLIRPEAREKEALGSQEDLLCVDFTHPSAVNENADYYCRLRLPFVMGTTGGNREALEEGVRSSAVSAVIAPNMAKQIVGLQAMMAFAAETFPDLFRGYSMTVRESHQQGKADTSGTAKAMVGYFNRMGIAFSESEIEKERDPHRQKTIWKIPERHLSGHAWHTYALTSNDETVRFEFTHNVNGREIYAAGALDAALFLWEKIRQGSRGEVFSMIDVLKSR